MAGIDDLERRVPAGEMIKPWLQLGPFYEDLSARVQGLTLFERSGSTVGETAMAEVVDGAGALLRGAPREGEEAPFRGQTGVWTLARRPDKFLSWGTYNIDNHLGAVFLSTLVTPDEPGPRRWRILVRISSRAVVAVNGEVVHDAWMGPTIAPGGSMAWEFAAPLRPGDNVVTVAIFRLGRMAQVGCRLEIVDGAVGARVPLGAGVSAAGRAGVEGAVAGLSLGRDLFYPDDMVGLNVAVAPPDGATLRARLLSAAGAPLREVAVGAAGRVDICRGDELDNGPFRIVCDWSDRDGRPLTTVAYDCRKETLTPAPPGHERLKERRRLVLEHCANEREFHRTHAVIWPEVARRALGDYEAVDEGRIRDLCAFITARKDCADFGIQGLLRLMYWERERPRLSPAIRALMKDTVLGFKYWVDEPGDTVMYMGSENHRLLFHVAEWLAGQLFPLEEFTNSRQRGLYHATKGRFYITEWLRQRGRFGFDEWHSNSYYPICLAPLHNIYDFAITEDAKLRQMAGAVLDYMYFNLAADSFRGIFGTTHGRSYGVNLKYPDLEGTAATCWLLFGTGALASGASGMAPVSIATSAYRLPPLLARIATDDRAIVESRVRQGILPGGARHANFRVYRTPDYLLSGLQDHRKGEYESSTHVAQVTLANKVAIFWSCPQTTGEGSGLRPDYWSGHTGLPRVVQHRNVLALSWRLGEWAWLTHCFFEQERFDEVRFAGNWAFARVGDGYVGIHSQGGLSVGGEGQYAGRELVCHAPETTWLVECGRTADWDTFDAFVAALEAAPVVAREGAVEFDSPSIGRFVTGWDVAPTAGGEPVDLNGYPLVDSPWAQSAFGSGELTIRHGDERYELWFNQ
ncbi:MAG: hypothetical protein AVDCRST_MAG88-2478 [uncultured Thermomicrobiales bacterium]|uniref:Uncharacterized protein n=1 Tax=uncultured Thermomicrobiales bacterium TaxID=1645740 RepID=A0A6J4V9U0_9BACT|nr:MAG: hypothetical protein AVDCRST_MAG88-2478 [uncultured Thermomicrobiales bacterium]